MSDPQKWLATDVSEAAEEQDCGERPSPERTAAILEQLRVIILLGRVHAIAAATANNQDEFQRTKAITTIKDEFADGYAALDELVAALAAETARADKAEERFAMAMIGTERPRRADRMSGFLRGFKLWRYRRFGDAWAVHATHWFYLSNHAYAGERRYYVRLGARPGWTRSFGPVVPSRGEPTAL